MNDFKLCNGDCLEEMDRIPDASVDMILTDLPYGTTRAKWDKRIKLHPLFKCFKRVIKENGAVCLFGQEPFSSMLRMSGKKYITYRYDWIWEKTSSGGFLNAHKKPLRSHEIISVFYGKSPTYNPQKFKISLEGGTCRERKNSKSKENGHFWGTVKNDGWKYVEDGTRFPRSVLHFSNWNGALFGNTDNAVKHPTQKPIDLLEYLIRTYTNEGETVLDSCMGSGSCGVACVQINRNFIGIEKDDTFYKNACEWIKEEQNKLDLFNEARNDAQT